MELFCCYCFLEDCCFLHAFKANSGSHTKHVFSELSVNHLPLPVRCHVLTLYFFESSQSSMHCGPTMIPCSCGHVNAQVAGSGGHV